MRRTFKASCHCGRVQLEADVRPFGRGYNEAAGGIFYAVNVGCLDDVDPTELAETPIQYVDGRHDAWASTPAETRHL